MTEPAVPRQLGPASAMALVVASMIGAGVFTTSGFVLADLGRREWVLLAWAVSGVIALAGAACYGALARQLPENGGEYLLLSRTVHPLAGFLAGWISLLAGFTAPIAAAAMGMQAYLDPVLGLDLRPQWIGTAAIAMATLMHLGRRPGIALQDLAVLVKLLVMAAFLLLGLRRLPDTGAEAALPGGFPAAAFAASLVWISFSYSGWNAAVYVTGELREARRTVLPVMMGAAAFVTLLYLALNALFLWSAPVSLLAGRAEVGAIAAEQIGGAFWGDAVSLLIALALFTSVSAMVMTGPRVYARMAEDGLFPELFSPGRGVPTAAVLLQAGLAVLVVWIGDLARLLQYIGFTLGLSTAATVAGLWRLRAREGPQKVPVPGHPWLPLFFVVATLGSSLFLALRQPAQALAGLATVALGVPLYFLHHRRAGD